MNKQCHYKADLAYIHDEGYGFFAEAAYVEIIKILRRKKISGGLIVDLGCGSGILAKNLTAKNYDVTGVDFSKEMISIAKKKAPKAKFIVSSVYDYKIPACNAVVSTGECFNYAFDSSAGLKRMQTVFKRIYTALPKDGFFLFDILSPGIMGKEKMIERITETNSWTLFLKKYEDDNKKLLTREMTIFRKKGSLYNKTKEVHIAKLYDLDAVTSILKKTGFKVKLMKKYGSYRFSPSHTGILAEK